MNKILLVTISIMIGALGVSFFWTMILDSHEKGHRNFEYVQCEQFWELAERYIESDYEAFDCELILEYGVLKFNPTGTEGIPTRETIPNKRYAYSGYVDDVIGRESE